MCKKDGNSAQCAWLFGHAHLTGETCIKFEYGFQIYFPALSFVLVAVVETFFADVDPFLTVLTAGFEAVGFLVVFFVDAFTLAADLRCLARSARSNSS